MAKKKRDSLLIWLVVVVAIVSALVFIYGQGLLGGKADFSVIVHYSYERDAGVVQGEPGPGTVTLTGNITNVGTEGGTPVVKISVNTGFDTDVFTIEAPPCVAGGSVSFEWTHHFDNVDPLALRIECEVDSL